MQADISPLFTGLLGKNKQTNKKPLQNPKPKNKPKTFLIKV